MIWFFINIKNLMLFFLVISTWDYLIIIYIKSFTIATFYNIFLVFALTVWREIKTYLLLRYENAVCYSSDSLSFCIIYPSFSFSLWSTMSFVELQSNSQWMSLTFYSYSIVLSVFSNSWWFANFSCKSTSLKNKSDLKWLLYCIIIFLYHSRIRLNDSSMIK